MNEQVMINIGLCIRKRKIRGEKNQNLNNGGALEYKP